MPPDASVLDRDVRIVKVKQPWAQMLVNEIKDVENRTWRLTPSTGFPAWVLVASSKSRPTRAMMADLRDRLRRHRPGGHTLALTHDTDPEKYVYGSILGLIKVEDCYREGPPQPSVWYNQGDVAWYVTEAWEFEKPVPLDRDDGMQTQVALANRPQYRARIVEEMGKLEAGLR